MCLSILCLIFLDDSKNICKYGKYETEIFGVIFALGLCKMYSTNLNTYVNFPE